MEAKNIRVWKPNSLAQIEALSRSEFEVAVGGNRGGGKSELGRVWLAEPEYIYNPNYFALVLRKNYTDMEEWIFKAKNFYGGLIKVNGKGGISFPGGGRGIVGHMANKDSWSKYVGWEIHKLLVEELNLFPDITPHPYLMLLGSMRSSDPTLTPQVFSSFNPGNVGHHFVKKRFVDVANGKPYYDPESKKWRIFIRLKLQENINLPPEYEQTLRLLPKDIQKAWIDGDFDALSGQMFPELPEKIEPRKMPKGTKYYGSFDFGCSENGHSSYGHWYIDEFNRPVRAFTWYHRAGKTASEQAQELYDYIRYFELTNGELPETVFADPNIFNSKEKKDYNDQSVAQYFIDKGLPFVQADNRRKDGWVIVQDYFGVDPRTNKKKCLAWDHYNEVLYEDFPLQVRSQNDPFDIEENNHDHVCDDVRYFLKKFNTLLSNNEVDSAALVRSIVNSSGLF